MANGSSLVFVGFLLTLVFTAACVYAVRRFRLSKNPQTASECSLHPTAIFHQLYNMHWKQNLAYCLNIVYAFICIPCLILIASCSNHGKENPGSCSWSLEQVTGSNATNAIMKHMPGAGGVAFGCASLILEFFFSIFVSMMAIRFYNESDMLAEGEFGHLRNDVQLSEDIQYEHQWVLWSRWSTFATFIWVIIFGSTGRILLFSVAHSYAAYSVPTLDSYSHGALVVAIMFSTIHFFSFLFLACRATWCESHVQNYDYAAFHCPVCSGTGVIAGSNNKPCEECKNGKVWSTQNSHFAPPILSNDFPVKSLTQSES